MDDNKRTEKIMLMYASAGAGHKIACRAIEQALIARGFTGEIKSIDTLEYMPPLIAKAFSKGYLWVAANLPWVWYAIYEHGAKLADFKPMPLWQMISLKLSTQRIKRLLIDEKPDYIISAYFTSSWLGARYKYLYNPRCRIATVATDYGLHQTWVQPGQDRYFVATQDNKIEMASFTRYTGVNADKIEVVGIPIEQRFTKNFNKAELRAKYNFAVDKFTVIILAGVYGKHHIEQLINKLCECQTKIQIIVVANKEFPLNAKLSSKLEKSGLTCNIYGRITFMEELMALSDVAITKTGGLTSSECMSCGLPMFVYAPYPGQEERNASLFLESGAAWRIYQLESLPHRVDMLARDPGKHQQMINAAKNLVIPDAALRIADTILTDLQAG